MDSEIMTLDEILEDPYYLEQYEKRIQATMAVTGYPQGIKGETMQKEIDINAEEKVAQSAAQETTETVKTFTQDDLNRVGAKEKKQGEAAILKELGLSSKEEIAAFKEQVEALRAERQKSLTVEDRLRTYEEQQATLKAERDAAIAEREQLHRENWISRKGVPEDKSDFYLFKIDKIMKSDDVDFEVAAEQYLTENPIEKTASEPAAAPPPMWGGAGRAPIVEMTKDEFKKMTYLDKLKLKQEKPDIFEKFRS